MVSPLTTHAAGAGKTPLWLRLVREGNVRLLRHMGRMDRDKPTVFAVILLLSDQRWTTAVDMGDLLQQALNSGQSDNSLPF